MCLISNQIKKKFIQLLLKKGKKENSSRIYKSILFRIKKQSQNPNRINPNKILSNVIKQTLQPVILKPISKKKSVIKYKTKTKQISLSIKNFIPNINNKIINLDIDDKKTIQNFYKGIRQHKSYT